MTNLLGIDIGGTFIKYGIVNDQGKILKSGKTETNRKNAESVLEAIGLIIENHQKEYSFSEVGISLPGVISKDGYMSTSGAIEGFKGRNIQKELSSKTSCKIKIINDANAIALAENWIGSGKHSDYFVCLTIGTGVGGSIVLNNQLLTGRSGAAGEIGMSLLGLARTYPVIKDSVSYNCGTILGLCRIYNHKLNNLNPESWETDVRKILTFAKEGQKEAIESLEEFYHNVAVLLLNTTVILDPELILLGGGISDNQEITQKIILSAENLLKTIPEINDLSLPEIKACSAGSNAGVVGAVAQFLN